MSFPSLSEKFADETSYPPGAFLEALLASGWTPGTVPESVLFTYARFELYLATRPDLYTPNHMLGTGPGRFYLVNDSDGRVGINCLGIGAPAAVAQMELQAELGARRFISIGTAGGFQTDLVPGDTVVATSAIRDEGTSYHYLDPEAPAVPDRDLNQAYAAALDTAGITFRSGATQTTDAPHRITRREIRHHRDNGVLTVEMEAAALFAAATALGVRCASAVVVDGVADEDASWHLDLPAANAALQQLFAATASFLTELA